MVFYIPNSNPYFFALVLVALGLAAATTGLSCRLGLALPKEPIDIFPLLVFLSPFPMCIKFNCELICFQHA
jgi:hypothetical protein